MVLFISLGFLLDLFGSFFVVFGSFWFCLVVFGSFTFLLLIFLVLFGSLWFFLFFLGPFCFFLWFCFVLFGFYFFRVLFGVHTFSWPTFVNILPNKCDVIYHTRLAGSNLLQCIGSTQLTQILSTLVH